MNLFDHVIMFDHFDFLFIELVKLTTKIYSSLSKKIMRYFLKIPIPILQRQFFSILFQNPENVGTHWNDMKNPLNFTICIWMKNNKLIKMKTDMVRVSVTPLENITIE